MRLLAVAAVLTALAPSAARAEVYVLSVGYNGVPPDAGDTVRAPLSYADDDAAAFFSFASSFSREGALLTVFDAATAARYPALTARARPPTHAELIRAVSALRARVLDEERAGGAPVVAIFYSGHGFLTRDGTPALALAEGALTQRVLYDEVFAALPARTVHFFVDACHAEAVVRPRDLTAQVVDVSAAERLAEAARSTLARFPHVGTVIASTADAESHEWDLYGSGIFTHQLLSGLRGAADVNGDQRVEYSEMAAFLSAANREVADPRARLKTVVAAPRIAPHAALVDLAVARQVGRLRGQMAALGAVHLEDERGNRLADLRSEPGFSIGLVLPADELIYLRVEGGQEAALRLRPGQVQDVAQLAFNPASTRARGAVDRMLRRGLFAAAFGPAYYRGFVDRTDFVPVSFLVSGRDDVPPPSPASGRTGPWVAFAAAGGLGVAAGGFGLAAWNARQDFDRAVYQRESAQARDRYEARANLALGLACGALVTAALGFFWLTRD
jgi:Caspase domain